LSELLGRFRFPLTYLLLALVCVIALSSPPAPGGERLGAGSRLLVEIGVPLQRIATLPVEQAARWWDDYLDLRGVRARNAELERELSRMREENLQYREAIVASERFERLRGFNESQNLESMVPADVIAKDLSGWFHAILIDRGASSGIRPGMPAITDSGLVGLVIGTTPNHSKLLLLTDPQSRVDVFVQRSRARGTLQGDAQGLCQLVHVLREADVELGDLVLTSGQDGIFPKGLIVGRATEVEREPYGLFQTVKVAPAADLEGLEEVFVILERRRLPDPEEFQADDPSLWKETDEAKR
jgi:rod shape-determining protein MreC